MRPGTDVQNRDNEIEVAEIAQQTLYSKIYQDVVELHNTDTDKYGRLLADVWFEGTNLSTWLIDQGLAVPYDGGTK